MARLVPRFHAPFCVFCFSFFFGCWRLEGGCFGFVRVLFRRSWFSKHTHTKTHSHRHEQSEKKKQRERERDVKKLNLRRPALDWSPPKYATPLCSGRPSAPRLRCGLHSFLPFFLSDFLSTPPPPPNRRLSRALLLFF